MIRTIVRKLLEIEKGVYIKNKLFRKTQKRPMPEKANKILCFQMNSIGDAIMTQPVWTELKNIYRESSIDLICQPHIASLMKNDPALNTVYPFSTRRYKNWLFNDSQKMNEVCFAEKYDLFIDFSAVPVTALACSDEKAPLSIGFKRDIETPLGTFDMGRAYDLSVPYSDSKHIRKLLLELLLPLDKEIINGLSPTLFLPPNDIKKAKSFLKHENLEPDKYIIIHPGAKWNPKRWPLENWIKLLRLILKDYDMPVLVVGGSQDKKSVDIIQKEVISDKISLYISTDINVSSALVKLAHLCLCMDSAAMHIAAATGTTSISMFGPVSPRRSAPGDNEGCHVLYEKLFCSPCELYYTHDRCRRGLNFCMYSIKPELVYQKIFELTNNAVTH